MALVTILHNPKVAHRHHWPDITLNALRPGAIARCDLCQQHAELRLMMFERGEALAWVEISSPEAVSKIPPPWEKEISEEEAQLRQRVEELEGVLRAVRADRPSSHSDRVWEMILQALEPR